MGDDGDVGEGGGGGDNGGAAKKPDKGVLSYGGVTMKETMRWLKKRYLSYKAMFRGENSVSTLKLEARRRSKAVLMRDAALWGGLSHQHGNRTKNATMAATFRKVMQVIPGGGGAPLVDDNLVDGKCEYGQGLCCCGCRTAREAGHGQGGGCR